MIDRKHSQESLAKMSAAKKGENHPQFGTSRSESTKAAISAANTGKRHTPETIEKLSGDNHWLRKVGWDAAHKEAVSRKMKGRVKSADHLAALAAFRDNMNPWDYAVANKDVWALAIEFKTSPLTRTETEKLLGVTRGATDKLFRKLKSGWNPCEDAEYVAWLAQHKNK